MMMMTLLLLLLKVLVWDTFLHELQGVVTQDQECLRSIRADIIFLIDGTNAIDEFSFEFYVKDYLNDFAKKLSIRSDGVLISVILYTNRLYMAVRPEHSVNLPTLLTAIRNMKQPGEHRTQSNIIHAISSVLNIAFTAINDENSENITRIAILLTSGDIQQKSFSKHDHSNIHGHNRNSNGYGWNPQILMKTSETIIKLLHSRVDYVFSIGMPGADRDGVHKLAKPLESAFILSYPNGYQDLDLRKFDPTEAFCPVKEYCTINGVRKLLNSKKSVERVYRRGNGIVPWYHYEYRKRNPSLRNERQQRRGHRFDSDYYDYGDANYDDRTPAERPTSYYKSSSDDETLNDKLRALLVLLKNYHAENEEQASQNTRYTTTTTETPNHKIVYPLRSQYEIPKVQQQKPLAKPASRADSNQHETTNTSNTKDPGMITQPAIKNETHSDKSSCESQLNKITDLLIFLLKQSLTPNGFNLATKVNLSVLNETSNGPLVAVSATEFSSNLQEIYSEVVAPKVEERRLQGDEQSKIKKLSLIDVSHSSQQFKQQISYSTNKVYFQPTDWQDCAMHNGAILMFAMKSHSGLSLSEVYSSNSDTSITPSSTIEIQPSGTNNYANKEYINNNASSYWYKHPLFNQWNSGLYKYVLFELWSNHNPIVQLKFDAQYSDRYTWFNKVFLHTSYPWDKNELTEKAKFIRTRNEPFSVIFDSNYIDHLSSSSVDQKTIQKLRSEPLNCEFLRGYLLIVDSPDSTIFLCEWYVTINTMTTDFQNENDNYPKFYYTLPINLPKEDDLTYKIPPKFSNYFSTLYEADELRIYVVPYSLMSTKIDDVQLPQVNTLLIVLDTNVNICFNQLWSYEIASPPSSYPLQNGNLCNCWYRNELLNNWYKPINNYSQNLNHFPTSNLLFDFKYVQIDLLNGTGHVKCRLVFDTHGAKADSWFSSTRLNYSWPLSITTLKTYNFVQFGRQILSNGEKRNLSESWLHFDFWIGKHMFEPQLLNEENKYMMMTCLSIFFVYSSENGADSYILPKCMEDQINVFDNSKLTTLAFSETLAQLNDMHKMQQIIIWTN
ncbi:unnamed protein product [Heterobilharzia americana]|nr:unnamed protein product [Heterobilharzia americana]